MSLELSFPSNFHIFKMDSWALRVALYMIFPDPAPPQGLHWPVIFLGTIITMKGKMLDLVGLRRNEKSTGEGNNLLCCKDWKQIHR